MAEKAKHIPTRKCIGCRKDFEKQNLLRIVKYGGKVFIDKTGKSDGRGAYFCGSKDCLKVAMKSRRLEKAFRMQIPADIYTGLEEFSANMEVQ